MHFASYSSAREYPDPITQIWKRHHNNLRRLGCSKVRSAFPRAADAHLLEWKHQCIPAFVFLFFHSLALFFMRFHFFHGCVIYSLRIHMDGSLWPRITEQREACFCSTSCPLAFSSLHTRCSSSGIDYPAYILSCCPCTLFTVKWHFPSRVRMSHFVTNNQIKTTDDGWIRWCHYFNTSRRSLASQLSLFNFCCKASSGVKNLSWPAITMFHYALWPVYFL